MKKTLFKGLILSSLILNSLPSHAVSFDRSYSASRYNEKGTTVTVMRATNNHFCFVSRVSLRDIDSVNEMGSCEAVRSGSNWKLKATLEQIENTDADVVCGAICYNL
ncbi:MAG: hypothetical protein COA99_16205 [Moraxellaceae bacterium]|nr:MAG: hypothetical protein COA99_16205 [Moraxellaceae bacterium]